MEFSRQEHWTGVPFPTPRNLPNPEIEPFVSCISCTGRQIPDQCATWEAQGSYSCKELNFPSPLKQKQPKNPQHSFKDKHLKKKDEIASVP